MKKTFFIISALCLMISCNNNMSPESETISDSSGILVEYGENFNTVVIDSCEYIYFRYGSGYAGQGGLCHKGNCKNH